MRITLMTQCWNEEVMLTYFLKYYEPVVDRIVFVDGNSTDGTNELIRNCKKGVRRERENHGMIDDEDRMIVRNTYWQEFRNDTDWFIWVDPDEFIYHPCRNLRGILSECDRQEVQLIQSHGYRMIGTATPALWSDLTKIIRMGIRDTDYEKPAVWKSTINPKFTYGGHYAENKIEFKTKACFMLLHYKHLSREWIQQRIARTQMAPRNYELRQGFLHNGLEGKLGWAQQYEETLQQAIRVI